MNILTNEEHPFDTEQGKTWLRDMLHMGPLTVTFTKKDGEERVMTCTLKEDNIPIESRPKVLAEGETPKKRNDNTISVWDLNANGWRSFVLANVKRVEFSL